MILGLFFRHVEIRSEGLLLDPSEIPAALVLGHRLTHLEEVSQHHSLTFRPQSRSLGERPFNLRGHIRRDGEQLLQLHTLLIDLDAPLSTLGQIGSVKIRHAFEFGVSQLELVP